MVPNVNEDDKERNSNESFAHMYLKSIVETRVSGSMSTRSFQRGLCSMRAQRSHRALTMAATAKCNTPFSGPTCGREGKLNYQLYFVNIYTLILVSEIHSLVYIGCLRNTLYATESGKID